MWDNSALVSPPPAPSPIKREGSYFQATRMTYRPLLALDGGRTAQELAQDGGIPDG
jgi:hypothetical protein